MPVRHKDFVETGFAAITSVPGRWQGADDAFSVLFALRSIEDQHKISIVVGVVSDACPRIFDRRERFFDSGLFEGGQAVGQVEELRIWLRPTDDSRRHEKHCDDEEDRY